ncbi:hemolysin family protein [Pontibacter burrus]|uniref:HlyC/CorC family transporter n=1 Tax=Pontibacter burrus TaxID=2704466 RepID=A0A6B3LQQ9_9BACT|nr:hemolysin family protein [Pontibacter burrus]NEM96328.1 HlyC/CorC family transporter [Pontibacter burrus]
MIEPDQIILLVTGLLLSAFFSGIEIAFMSANRLQIELNNKNGVLSGRILWHLLQYPSRLMGTTLIGNTLALVLYGFAIAGVIHNVLDATFPNQLQYDLLILFVQIVVASVLVLLTAEFLPRNLFAINPNRMLQILALPILLFYYLLYPVVFAIVGLSKLVAEKLFKVEFQDQKPVFGYTDLNTYIKSRLYHSTKEDAPDVNPEIFHNVLEFKNVKVRECMVPRTEIEAVEENDPVDLLRQTFIETGHSKILVYRDNIDNIIGYCHQLDMFKQPKNITDILAPVSLVPESMLASELFVKFVAEHRSVAVVLDEFGGTAGIITVEDVIEEIFGEIEDEYDLDDTLEQAAPEKGIYMLSARLEIDYLNDKYDLGLPEGDYETLGGFIFSEVGEIPSPGDIVEHPPFQITILTMDENRINTVRLVKVSDLQGEPKY